MTAKLWAAFSEDSDHCEDKVPTESAYRTYTYDFLDEVPDKDEKLDFQGFLSHLASTEPDDDLIEQIQMTRCEASGTLREWMKFCIEPAAKNIWRAILQQFFFYYELDVVKVFLKKEGYEMLVL